MADARPGALERLAEGLGYPPGEYGRLATAVTHKSFANEADGDTEHNERLEFLGDAVVGLAVAHGLMSAHPSMEEGTLSRLRAGLVNARSLAEMARELGVGEALRLGRGEERSGGRDKDSLLADAYEAIIGAVFLDRGFDAARAAVDEHFGERFEEAETSAEDRDYKTRVQELAQARFQTTPDYVVVAATGPDHAKLFEVELYLLGELRGRGTGRSKKQAERAAARMAWLALQHEVAPPVEEPSEG